MRSPSLPPLSLLLVAFLFAGRLTLNAANPPAFQASWLAPKDPVYVGERFYLTLEVISREGSLTKNIRLEGLPPTNQLLCESFADLPVEIKSIGDQICEIRRFRSIAALRQPGPCELKVTLQGTQIRKVQNYFFTQREERNVSLPATPMTLHAIPLPATNRPPSFLGAIGTGFALSAQLAPTSVVVGDLVTIQIRLQTDNPLASPSPPTMPDLPEFKSYPLKTETSPATPLVWNFSQIVIPLSDQAGTWGPVTFSYFDPRRDAYVVLSQGPFVLTFLPERPTPTADYRPSPTPATGTRPIVQIMTLRTGDYPGFKAFAELYGQGQFSAALKLPDSADPSDSAALAAELFNRGCAWLAGGVPEKAAAVFRAGLYGNPRDADLQKGFRQAVLSLTPTPPRQNLPPRVWEQATLREWRFVLWLGLGLLGAGIWIRRRANRWSPLAIGLLILAVVALILASGGIQYRKDLSASPEAILTPASTPVNMAPSESAQRYTDLPRGTWIRIRESNGDWIRISTDSVTGWIPTSAAEIITP